MNRIAGRLFTVQRAFGTTFSYFSHRTEVTASDLNSSWLAYSVLKLVFFSRTFCPKVRPGGIPLL